MNVVSYRPGPAELAYTFGGRPAVGTVRPGTILELYTEDCFGGRVRSVDDLPSKVCEFPYLNPVTGPFHVEGAEPGDTLALHFVAIEPARDWAVSTTFPHFGALTATHTTAMLHPPLDEVVWRYDVDAEKGVVRYRARRSDFTVELPLDPMHGTVGVAPGASEARMTITPDAHGGNMDTPELRAGVTVYLGVNVAGGLFAIGDGHARQGHGEVCGTAVEAAMNTVVAVELIKGVSTPWPRLEDDGHLMSTGSARPLEDAYRISQHDLVTWAAELTGLDVLDAYQLVSQAGQAPVGNVCDSNYTMVAKLPKDYLGGPAVYESAHDRLRSLGRRYLSER
ncbi:acetamidase/formamidase family protein [Planomonospora venezuelensis]|uniref:Acetamidase/formamidase n=1 Tax=Planomonospora venezuelensis TaxID=1999 RepID=A0A841D8M4_PLAVE|nr:acetamidase/formamidase family protein [Planomonospora venezuelensis]MBB5964475.1 acetamidase/formamidase [Planomonospora venezuelensis]GIN04210.1 amidase [Planomonospora venezuelensis]